MRKYWQPHQAVQSMHRCLGISQDRQPHRMNFSFVRNLILSRTIKSMSPRTCPRCSASMGSCTQKALETKSTIPTFPIFTAAPVFNRPLKHQHRVLCSVSTGCQRNTSKFILICPSEESCKKSPHSLHVHLLLKEPRPAAVTSAMRACPTREVGGHTISGTFLAHSAHCPCC
jgi:hypothetical protein